MTELCAEIEAAFGAVEVPLAETILAEPYRNSEDPGHLAAALGGKHWREVSSHDLFFNRESINALSANGYRAYIGAFLLASLEDDNGEESTDIAVYVLYSLHPLSPDARDVSQTRERLSAVDGAQRAAIHTWLRHVQGYLRLAEKVVQNWS
jgi:hypothetical protein